jgi:hypothetical protein
MDKKGISKNVIVLIIVAILVVSAIAVYLVTSGRPSDGTATDTTNNGGTTDTTNGETTDSTNDNGTTDTTNNGGTTVDVSGASSLKFKVIMDPADGDNIDYTYNIKNAGTSSLMMRIEMQTAGESFIYIINGDQEKVWMYSDGEWMDFSEMYPTYWETWNSAWQGYHDTLIDWTGVGDWTYTTPTGDSVRIYDITINPSLPDSLFQH